MSVRICYWAFLYPDAWLESISAAFNLNLRCRIVELKLNCVKV